MSKPDMVNQVLAQDNTRSRNHLVIAPVGDPMNWRTVRYELAGFSDETFCSAIFLSKHFRRLGSTALAFVYFDSSTVERIIKELESPQEYMTIKLSRTGNIRGIHCTGNIAQVSAAISSLMAEAVLKDLSIKVDLTHGWNIIPVLAYSISSTFRLFYKDITTLVADPLNGRETEVTLAMNELQVYPSIPDLQRLAKQFRTFRDSRFISLPDFRDFLEHSFLSYAYFSEGVLTFSYYHFKKAIRFLSKDGLHIQQKIMNALEKLRESLEHDERIQRNLDELEGLTCLNLSVGFISQLLKISKTDKKQELEMSLNFAMSIASLLPDPLKTVATTNIRRFKDDMKKQQLYSNVGDYLKTRGKMSKDESSNRNIIAHSGFSKEALNLEQTLNQVLQSQSVCLRVEDEDPIGFGKLSNRS